MISRLPIDQKVLEGSRVVSEKLHYPYVNDQRAENPDGRIYETICPRMGWEKCRILVESNVAAVPALWPEGVEVPEEGAECVWDGLVLECYRPQQGFGLAVSGKADSVRLATPTVGRGRAAAANSDD